ncbi:MAG TPA: SHOCT domain-containing protein [Candidatus Scatomorpha stercoravium]|nr:SHOCT domain-containing protein [Candidatus Scatomorpha stercoravium]
MRSAVSGSLAEELLKFKQLLDIGAITQDEFNAMKKQLMDI